MTVRDWIVRRATNVPAALVERMLSALGPDADAAESQTGDRCLAAAARALDALLGEQRFERESALDLLAVDALATYGYEHASASRPGQLRALAEAGAHRLAQLLTQRA